MRLIIGLFAGELQSSEAARGVVGAKFTEGCGDDLHHAARLRLPWDADNLKLREEQAEDAPEYGKENEGEDDEAIAGDALLVAQGG